MRSRVAVKSSMIGVIAQISTMLVAFVTQRVFIQYLNVSILGINGVITNVLSLLSLAELGIQSAIVFRLYSPLRENNQLKITQLMILIKRIYRYIAVSILVIGLILSAFLGLIIKGIEYDLTFIRTAFFIHLSSTVLTYLLAHRRALLYADQKQHIITIYDTSVNIVISIFKIISLVLFQNYFVYLVLQVIQVIFSNFLILHYSSVRYPYLKMKLTVDDREKMNLREDIRDVFAGKIAGFVYSSTDNLVISTMLGTTAVGYLINYKFVISALVSVMGYILSPIQPIIGDFLAEKKDKENAEQLLANYTFIRYCLVTIFLVPTLSLIQMFISIWIGDIYLLSFIVVILLAVDFYISYVHGPTGEFINGLGMFKYEKYVSITGATINLLSSIIGVMFLGLPGVLIGTVISQLIMWIGRSFIVFKFYFEDIQIKYIGYWKKQIVYALNFILLAGFSHIMINSIFRSYNWISFILGGLVSVIITGFGIFIFLGKTSEFKFVLKLLLITVKK